jgi:phosphoribosylaminoimidazolecarboxamide formyltransferase/IMP cyclohydrolase
MKLNASELLTGLQLKQSLRYGENPHQNATWCVFPDEGLSTANQLQGKELSYNNLIDLDAAVSTVQEFKDEPAAVVIKHTNPCGVAIAETVDLALRRALDSDRVSCFGGIIALNREVDAYCAREIIGAFYECIVAPSFNEDALKILSTKKNLRLLELDIDGMKLHSYNMRSILGGVLVQEKDNESINTDDWKTVTERQPTTQEVIDLTFAWKVCRHVRSNAILIAKNGVTLGVGAGQMNRVGSANIALQSADPAAGAALASDGFFPFGDTVKLAYDYGIKAVIQPGGSIKDQESIDACNELGITMICTGKRHFLH